ncbi:MAG: hypothetical protein MHMPM18_001031 [Marteilia pararefringens]
MTNQIENYGSFIAPNSDIEENLAKDQEFDGRIARGEEKRKQVTFSDQNKRGVESTTSTIDCYEDWEELGRKEEAKDYRSSYRVHSIDAERSASFISADELTQKSSISEQSAAESCEDDNYLSNVTRNNISNRSSTIQRLKKKSIRTTNWFIKNLKRFFSVSKIGTS